MATEYGNIDDMLAGATAPSTPPTSESKDTYVEPDDAPENDNEIPESDSKDDFYSTPEEKAKADEEPDEVEDEPEASGDDYDDYGNAKAPAKTYTEEEVNERINKAVRERLARGNNQNQQPTQQQVEKQAQDFEYNPESAESWQTQLEKFVEKTVSKMGQKQAEQQQIERDHQVQAEFEEKFSQGMGRFGDFREVVGSQPITDPMTYALREMSDPAAFIYAASKRHPAELQRIANLPSRNAQMIEMGKLEERMRKVASGTKAPKPVSRSRDDGGMPTKVKKTEPSIEDLIAKSDAKRRAALNQKRGR
jgi:hypothetical protein